MREPLKLGMRFLAWYHHIDPSEYTVRTPACYGCIRFYKTALKGKSVLFRYLNDLVNPLFDAVLERIVTEEELREAKTYAKSATCGEVSREESAEWMVGRKTGF